MRVDDARRPALVPAIRCSDGTSISAVADDREEADLLRPEAVVLRLRRDLGAEGQRSGPRRPCRRASALSAKATFWPRSGTVARLTARARPGGGLVRPTLVRSVECRDDRGRIVVVGLLLADEDQRHRQVDRVAVRVRAADVELERLAADARPEAPCALPAMSSFSGGSSSGETSVRMRTASNGIIRSTARPAASRRLRRRRGPTRDRSSPARGRPGTSAGAGRRGCPSRSPVELPLGDLDHRRAVAEREQEPGDRRRGRSGRARASPGAATPRRRGPVGCRYGQAPRESSQAPSDDEREQVERREGWARSSVPHDCRLQPEVRRQVHDVVPVERVERHPPRVVVVVGDAERRVRRRRRVERPDRPERPQRVVAVDQRPVLAPDAEPRVPQLGVAGLARRWPAGRGGTRRRSGSATG